MYIFTACNLNQNYLSLVDYSSNVIMFSLRLSKHLKLSIEFYFIPFNTEIHSNWTENVNWVYKIWLFLVLYTIFMSQNIYIYKTPHSSQNPIKLHIIITYMMTDHNNDVTMVMMMIMVMTKTTQQNNIFIIYIAKFFFPNKKK